MKKLKLLTALLLASSMVLSGCSITSDEAPAEEVVEQAENDDTSEETQGSEETEAADSAYPERPITLIVPYAAGGTTDTHGRELAARLSEVVGQPITVVNQGGASGSIGSQFVYDEPADGYTLLLCAETMGTYKTLGVTDLGYEDFTVITPVVGDPKVIVVSEKSEYETLEDLLEAIAENPGRISMSHSGPGGSGHNQGLVLGELGYEVSMTSFDSGNEALLGVDRQEVDFTNPNISTIDVEDNRFRILAVFASERMEAYPDIPAFTEFIPEADKYLNIPYTVLSLLVHEETPSEVVATLKQATSTVFATEAWENHITNTAAEKLYEKYTTDEEIDAFYDYWKSIVCWLQYDNGVATVSPEEFGIERID